MKISVNGQICDEREAVVSAYDHGFLYGIGLFETFRTYGGKPFLLQQHLRRMQQGCEMLQIRFVPDELRLESAISQLLEANGLTDGYIRYTVSAGTDVLGLPDRTYADPTEIIYIKQLPSNEQPVQRGKPLQLLRTLRNTPETQVRLKSLHYMNNIVAKRELAQYSWAKGAEGLFLNADGNLAEGIVSNLFFVRSGVCLTPSLDAGILPGITREFVLNLAKMSGVRVEEGLYEWHDLLQADEIFLTNSIQEIVPVCRLFDTKGHSYLVGDGSIGKITDRLLSLYREQIETLCLDTGESAQ